MSNKVQSIFSIFAIALGIFFIIPSALEMVERPSSVPAVSHEANPTQQPSEKIVPLPNAAQTSAAHASPAMLFVALISGLLFAGGVSVISYRIDHPAILLVIVFLLGSFNLKADLLSDRPISLVPPTTTLAFPWTETAQEEKDRRISAAEADLARANEGTAIAEEALAKAKAEVANAEGLLANLRGAAPLPKVAPLSAQPKRAVSQGMVIFIWSGLGALLSLLTTGLVLHVFNIWERARSEYCLLIALSGGLLSGIVAASMFHCCPL